MQPGTTRTRLLPWLAAAALATLTAVGHEALNRAARHDVAVAVGAMYIDVTVTVTLRGDAAAAYRRGLDRDGNGQVAPEELDAAPPPGPPEQCPLLSVAGRAAPLLPLYAPEVDLMGAAGTDGATVAVCTTWFAFAPEGLPDAFEAAVEDRYLPGEAALLTRSARGETGLSVHLEGARSELLPAGTPRVLKLRCTRDGANRGRAEP